MTIKTGKDGARKREVRSDTHGLISDDTLREMYASMMRLRKSARDAGVRNLGAVLVAAVLQMREDDFVFAPPGVASGLTSIGEISVISAQEANGAQLPMSAGAAWALHKTDEVVVVFGTPERRHRAAWNETLQLAGRHRLPLLLVLLPAKTRTRAAMEVASIASEAMRNGVTAIPVDAADAVAMYRVIFESLARARRRTGATLILATPHALEDGARPKKTPEDPVARMKSYLKDKGLS